MIFLEYYQGKISELTCKIKNSAVTLGKFDGLHKGHKLLIDKVVESKYTSVMFSLLFSDSPNIYTSDEKKDIVKELGIDVMIECPFEETIKKMSHERFIKEIIHDLLDARIVVVGADFRFGYNRLGDIQTLKQMQNIYNYKLIVIDKLENVSSTIIKNYIVNADVQKANELLSRNWSIQGIVKHGNAIGRTIGIPTINLIPDSDKLVLANGVYASYVYIDGKKYEGITNIGYKPTIEGEKFLGIETNIFDFEMDVYGKLARVEFRYFVRGEKKFNSVEELCEQMKEDILYVKGEQNEKNTYC